MNTRSFWLLTVALVFGGIIFAALNYFIANYYFRNKVPVIETDTVQYNSPAKNVTITATSKFDSSAYLNRLILQQRRTIDSLNNRNNDDKLANDRTTEPRTMSRIIDDESSPKSKNIIVDDSEEEILSEIDLSDGYWTGMRIYGGKSSSVLYYYQFYNENHSYYKVDNKGIVVNRDDSGNFKNLSFPGIARLDDYKLDLIHKTMYLENEDSYDVLSINKDKIELQVRNSDTDEKLILQRKN